VLSILRNPPTQISVMFWDVNGTITSRDKLDEEVAQQIIFLAEMGVYHAFITGRDRIWLQDFLVNPMRKICEDKGLDSEKVLGNMGFYPELGLIYLEPPSLTPLIFEGVEDHPLVSSSLRQRLATLFWQGKSLQEWGEGEKIPPRFYVSRDANGNGFLFPMVPYEIDVGVKFPDFIWSESKELIGTAEIVREVDNHISLRRASKINLVVKILEELLEYWEVKTVSVSPVSTAINFAPIIDSVSLDKDWTVGRVLKQLSDRVNLSVEEIAGRAIAIGDGKADFLFSRPLIDGKPGLNIPFVFVGSEENYQPRRDQEMNVIIRSSDGKFGPEVTRDVLEHLQRRFVSL